jgi:hypothetical protein
LIKVKNGIEHASTVRLQRFGMMRGRRMASHFSGSKFNCRNEREDRRVLLNVLIVQGKKLEWKSIGQYSSMLRLETGGCSFIPNQLPIVWTTFHADEVVVFKMCLPNCFLPMVANSSAVDPAYPGEDVS